MKERKQYVYRGAVLCFDRMADANWSGSTMAVSLRQAESNLAYQFKREAGRSANTPVKLAGVPRLAEGSV